MASCVPTINAKEIPGDAIVHVSTFAQESCWWNADVTVSTQWEKNQRNGDSMQSRNAQKYKRNGVYPKKLCRCDRTLWRKEKEMVGCADVNSGERHSC